VNISGRILIYDVVDTNFSSVNLFTISNINGNGYLAIKQGLKLFYSDNVDYSPEMNSLVLNTELKPPYPTDKFLLDSVMISLPMDSTHPSTFTTDGTYFYFGHLPVWTTDSKIYKIGTGYNGTVKGQDYGSIPNLEVYIYSHLMSHEGHILCLYWSFG
jgi:hypothetical protein